jgi:hypothetical protein
MWGDHDVQRVGDYRVTGLGREEADRMRRLRREAITDFALATHPQLVQPWMTESQRRAISEPLTGLRLALDGNRYATAIGAAKDLVEAACKLAIERASGSVPRSASLPILFKQAHRTVAAPDQPTSDLGRSLAATVQRLAELRNVAGAGHGHASAPTVAAGDALMAASAARGIAIFLLSR